MIDAKSIRAELEPIEWWPGKWRTVIKVPKALVTEANSNLVPRVSTANDWQIIPANKKQDYGTKIFSRAVSAGDMMAFYFEPAITLAPGATFAEVLVDTPVRSQKDYEWPSIMFDSRLIGDVIKQDRTTSNRVPIVRGRWQQGMTLPTWTTVSTYASLLPPPEELLETNKPIPTLVRGDYYGHPVGPLMCLHPRVELRSRASTDAEKADLKPDVDVPGEGDLMEFGATNHLLWIDHISDVDLTPDGGLYKRTVVTREAPFMPPLSYI